MKFRNIFLVAAAVPLVLVACKKKESERTSEASAPVETAAQAETPAPAPAPAAPKHSPAERAAELGFVQYLPQDTEVVMAFHNGSESAQRIKSSKLWELLRSEMNMSDSGENSPADEAFGPASLFGTEFTIALGKSTGEQTGNLLTLNRRMGYFQMRELARAFAASAKSGDFSAARQALSNQYGADLLKDLLADLESGVAMFERMKMPPLCLAFRSSPENREPAARQLAALTENLGMLGEMAEPVEVRKAGQSFAGYKISGAKISEFIATDRSQMESLLEAAEVDRLLAAIAKKDLVILSGTLGDYAILFIGASTDDLNFAPDITQSLVANDSLAFCDAYAAKKLAAVIHGNKDAIQQIIAASGGLSDMTEGLRDGLAGAEGLGDTRDIEALLRMVAEREAALRELAGSEAVGIAAFFEDGLKIESHGGTDYGAVDWKASNRLSSLGDSQDVVLFANMTREAAHDEKTRAYFEALMETAYALAMKAAEFPMEDGRMARIKEMTGIFDSKFRPDAVALWEALRGDFSAGLGGESALVVDLNGAVPAIPGLPQAVVDEAKFPRVSWVAPVTDRAKLASAWEKMNASTTSILAKIGGMNGRDFPMQKPISSEKNGFTTWFFPLPFFNDDFVPSVTVGDQWFAASSSKNHALDLLAKAATGGETSGGLRMTLNFQALRKFTDITREVISKNPDTVPMAAENLENLRKLGAAMEDLDRLSLHARREGGVLRTSIHLKSR